MNDLLNLIHSFLIISSRYFFIIYCFFNLIRISNDDFIFFVFKLISWFISLRLNNSSFSNTISNTSFKFSSYLGISFFITFKFIFSFRIIRFVFCIQSIPINMSRFMSVTHVTTLLTSLSILIHSVTISFSCILSFVTVCVHSLNTGLMSSPFFWIHVFLIIVVHVSVSISLSLSTVFSR